MSSAVPDAACDGADPDLFFPSGEDFRGQAYAAEAHRVITLYCKRCPSRAECEDLFRSYPVPPQGIWAGLSEAQRRGRDTPSCRRCGRAVDPLFPSTECRACRQEDTP